MVGSLTHADGPSAVVMVHGFLSDRDGYGLFPLAAKGLRRRGWASLRFDQSGAGESDDTVLTPQGARHDVSTAISLMRSLGYRQIVLWGHGLGTRFCLEHCQDIDAMVLADAMLGRARPTLRRSFSSAQIASLTRKGRMVHFAGQGLRKRFVIDASMLDYFSMFEPEAILPKVRCPVLALHAREAADGAALPQNARPLMRMLSPASRHVLVAGSSMSVMERPEDVVDLGVRWTVQHGASRLDH